MFIAVIGRNIWDKLGISNSEKKFDSQLGSLGDSMIESALVISDEKSIELLVEIGISPGTDVTALLVKREEARTRKFWSLVLSTWNFSCFGAVVDAPPRGIHCWAGHISVSVRAAECNTATL